MAHQEEPEEQPYVVETQSSVHGYIPANHWALPYHSKFTMENGANKSDGTVYNLNDMLRHVNCSYLSTPGRPPTLLALKQHAQSLATLIWHINPVSPDQAMAEIDNENLTTGDDDDGGGQIPTFNKGQAFDYLNNLQIPYGCGGGGGASSSSSSSSSNNNNFHVVEDIDIGLDASHHRPLNALVNLIKSNSDTDPGGVQYHCPLDRLAVRLAEEGGGVVEGEEERQPLPFDSHMTLLMHANECLERLDHEYSAMGGLLGILPSEEGKEEEGEGGETKLDYAKRTLLGQWILSTNQLYLRMHELEVNYATALDFLAGRAEVPWQTLKGMGVEERSMGREVFFSVHDESPSEAAAGRKRKRRRRLDIGETETVYPQDNFILANAGAEVVTWIHNLLDVEESRAERRDKVHDERGCVGGTSSAAFHDDDDDEYEGEKTPKGIVSVDLVTRFSRLRRNRRNNKGEKEGEGEEEEENRGPLFVLPGFGEREDTKGTRGEGETTTTATVVLKNKSAEWPTTGSSPSSSEDHRHNHPAPRAWAMGRMDQERDREEVKRLRGEMGEMRRVGEEQRGELERLRREVEVYKEAEIHHHHHREEGVHSSSSSSAKEEEGEGQGEKSNNSDGRFVVSADFLVKQAARDRLERQRLEIAMKKQSGKLRELEGEVRSWRERAVEEEYAADARMMMMMTEEDRCQRVIDSSFTAREVRETVQVLEALETQGQVERETFGWLYEAMTRMEL